MYGGVYGASGCNMLYGPRFQDWDMNLEKNVTWDDHYTIQLRADAFNISNSNVGTVTGISGTPTCEAPTMEFAVKFNF